MVGQGEEDHVLGCCMRFKEGEYGLSYTSQMPSKGTDTYGSGT